MKPPTRSPKALRDIERAFERFKATVTPSDARSFEKTELKDVWSAAKEIERQLSAKQANRNLHRIEPLLKGLENYSRAVEVLCNGTPYLPWIWAPIKLFVQIASDYLSAFEKLIKAYALIAESLPRFDRLSSALKEQTDFQDVLAVLYTDILEFHRRAYKFFRANGWKRLFNSSWSRFDIRFNGVIESLKQHSDLVDREANAHNISMLQDWRRMYFEDLERKEVAQFNVQFEAVLSWLDFKDYKQQDDVDKLSYKCHEGTSDWLLKYPKMQNWLSNGSDVPVLWLHGIPGSGKSVLCASLVRYLQANSDMTSAFFVCNFRTQELNECSNALRAMTVQIVKQHRHLSSYVLDEYVNQGVSPTRQNLKKLLPFLLSNAETTRLVIDGLDECIDTDEQRNIVTAMLDLVKTTSTTQDCKVIFFSRSVPSIEKCLKTYPTISLRETMAAGEVEKSIRIFTQNKIKDLRSDLEDLSVPNDLFEKVEEHVVQKADGMFLYVRLMFSALANIHSQEELQDAIWSLPDGLQEAYGRILDLMEDSLPKGSLRKARRILNWVAYAERPLKYFELLDGVALSSSPHQLTHGSKLLKSVLDVCKPLVEMDESGTVSFVHFSAKEYLLEDESGPFIKECFAVLDIASACTAYILSSLDFVDPNIPHEVCVERVAQGLHGLHPYATVNWLKHIRIAGESRKSAQASRKDSLTELAKRITTRHQELLSLNPTATDDTSDGKVEVDVHASAQSDLLQSLAEGSWRHENSSSTASTDEFEDGTVTESLNFTLLPRVDLKYDEIVSSLLADESEVAHAKIDNTVIRRFKETYGRGAFPCRFVKCPRQSEGFNSGAHRDEHEALHQPRRYCSEPSCEYATSVGFLTLKSLRQHIQKYHPPRESTVPKFLRSIAMSHTDSATAQKLSVETAISEAESRRPKPSCVKASTMDLLDIFESRPILPTNKREVREQRERLEAAMNVYEREEIRQAEELQLRAISSAGGERLGFTRASNACKEDAIHPHKLVRSMASALLGNLKAFSNDDGSRKREFLQAFGDQGEAIEGNKSPRIYDEESERTILMAKRRRLDLEEHENLESVSELPWLAYPQSNPRDQDDHILDDTGNDVATLERELGFKLAKEYSIADGYLPGLVEFLKENGVSMPSNDDIKQSIMDGDKFIPKHVAGLVSGLRDEWLAPDHNQVVLAEKVRRERFYEETNMDAFQRTLLSTTDLAYPSIFDFMPALQPAVEGNPLGLPEIDDTGKTCESETKDQDVLTLPKNKRRKKPRYPPKKRTRNKEKNGPDIRTQEQSLKCPSVDRSQRTRPLTKDEERIEEAVDEAVRRATKVGKQDLALAVLDIFEWSLSVPRLQDLLKAVLEQRAAEEETEEFQDYVRKVKRKRREENEKRETSDELSSRVFPCLRMD